MPNNPNQVIVFSVRETCAYCQGRFQEEDEDLGVDSDGDSFCSYCRMVHFFECEHCEEVVSLTATSDRDDEHRNICPECFETNYVACIECDIVIDNDYAYQYRGDRFCEACYEQVSTQNVIHSWDFKPPLNMRGDGPRYFGFELEVEYTPRTDAGFLEEKAHEFQKDVDELQDGLLYLTHDGSINNGFEITSHPTSIEWMRNNKKCYEPIWGLGKKGFKSHQTSTCGLHVHISRASFDRLQLYRYLEFIYDVENKPLITSIARRYGGNYYRFDLDYGLQSKSSIDTPVGDKYSAVNTGLGNTIETRIFKGTLIEQSFFARLEFCEALADYSTEDFSAGRMKSDSFLEYITPREEKYPSLLPYIKNYHLNGREVPV